MSFARVGPLSEELEADASDYLMGVVARLIGEGEDYHVIVVANESKRGVALLEQQLLRANVATPTIIELPRKRWYSWREFTVAVSCRTGESLQRTLAVMWPYRRLAIVAAETVRADWKWLNRDGEPSMNIWKRARFILTKFDHGFWVEIRSKVHTSDEIAKIMVTTTRGEPAPQYVEGDYPT